MQLAVGYVVFLCLMFKSLHGLAPYL